MKYIVNHINNIQNYLPIFRDTACCLGSYTCTVVFEAGNRVCDRSTRENYLQSESQHGRLHFLISVNFDILLGFWFLFFFGGGGYNVNIHLYMIHFWNTLTLRKVQLPTDVSRLNCVFERNGDMIPRA